MSTVADHESLEPGLFIMSEEPVESIEAAKCLSRCLVTKAL